MKTNRIVEVAVKVIVAALTAFMKTNRIVEVAVKVIVAALTAFLTAITTTSCMGHGPIAL